MPARIVLATAGSYGDLFPALGLGLALQARGHDPIVATCPAYRAIVLGEGLRFHPVRPDMDPSDTVLLRRVMNRMTGSEVIIRELAIPFIRESYADLAEAASGANLVVTHPLTFSAPLMAERLGIPWISTVLAPLSFFSAFDFPVLPPMPAMVHVARLGPWAGRAFYRLAKAMAWSWTEPFRVFRAELGLPPGGDPLFEGQFSPHGTLALFSPVLARPQTDWPERTRATGFVFYSDRTPMPDDLARFLDAGDPPIVFTLGSSAVGAAGSFYQESAKAAAALGRRAVLLVGKHAGNRPETLAPGVMAVDYAPHQALFARAAAVVHHGGVGTTAQALRAGHPMLVVPWAHDQPDNAFRMKNLGVARVLYPARYASARLVRELRTLLEDSSYAVKAAEIGRVVRAEDGAGAACDAIEEILRR